MRKLCMILPLALIVCFMVGCSKTNTIRVAAIQMNCKVGELDTNLANAEKFIRKAFEQNAELVILPEFFTTPAVGFPFNLKIVEAVCPLNEKPMQLLKRLSQEYNGIVGGSFLAFHGEDIYNSFVLVFPDGTYFVHNKDFPTFSENCYYTGGTDDGVFETPIGNIGVALCWEFIRTGTAKRLLDRVDIVIGGSCWPALVNPEIEPESASISMLKKTLSQFACLVGVPVIHSNHVGEVRYYSEEDPTKSNVQFYGGETQIVDGYGKIVERLSYQDGEAIIFADVILGKVDTSTDPIPDRFWIPELDEESIKYFNESLTGSYRRYYEETTLPHYLKKATK
ncbi:carbon-nitrogen hydrolase family protein [Acidobacteriota bacterium]